MSNEIKTLVGKNNYLFLNNDSCQEIKYHQKNNNYNNNTNYNNTKKYSKYQNKLMVVIFPDKSIIYNKFLPDGVDCIYRGPLDAFKNYLGDILHDPYDYLINIEDNYYYSDDIENIYCTYFIKEKNIYNMTFYNYDYIDKTNDLVGKVLSWDIISEYIIITNNNESLNDIEIIIFYDSFLLSSLTLYMKTFRKIIFIKKPFNAEYIDKFNMEYIIELKVERFLNIFMK
jgi:hypothetical protein